MLWNSIFEFFVKYVFGGVLNGGSGSYVNYRGTLGGLINSTSGNPFEMDSASVICFQLVGRSGTTYDFPLGNYLSLIATIISIVAIVIFCILIIKKIFNICFNLFTGRSIF